MKQLLLAVLVLGTTTAFGQKNAVDKYFTNYKNNDTYLSLEMTGKMFELTTHIQTDDPEEQELLDALSQIEGLAAVGSDSLSDAVAQYNAAIAKPGREFEELMNIKDKANEATFFIKENDGVVTELLVIAHGEKEFGIGSIWGAIDLKTVSKLMKEVDMTGMDMYDEKAVEYKESVNYFPNPVKAGQNGTLKVPSDMTGIQMKIYDLKGNEVVNRVVNDVQTEVPLANLAAGTYILNLYNGNTRFYVERIVVAR